MNKKFPEYVNDIGLFALPGNSADKNGATLWMPNTINIAMTTKNLEAARIDVCFVKYVYNKKSPKFQFLISWKSTI
ncbi:MAG: hypothetical protein WDA14_14445 [Sphaerochaetaceae bacterium]